MKTALTLTALALAASALPQDQSPKLLTIETFMQMESVGSPDISPDGRQVIFSRSWVDPVLDRSRSSLWITDVEGRRIREITHGDWSDSSPVWSPDGTKIAFLSDRDGTTQLHVMWMDTREVAQLTHLERAPGSVVWSPDGKQLAFTAFVPDIESPLSVKLPSRPRGAQWAAPAVLVDRLSWQRDGSGYAPPGDTHVFTIDAILGGTPRQVTSGKYSHSGPQWSADGKTVYVSGIRKPDAEYLNGDSEVYAVDLESLEVKPLTDRKGPDGNQEVSPDGRWIAYTGFDDQNFTSHIASLYLMDAEGGNKKVLAGNLSESPGNVTWASDSSGVYFTMGAKGSVHVYFAGRSGTVRQITTGATTHSGLSVSRSGLIATVRSDFTTPGRLVTFPASNARQARELVDVNSDVLEGVTLGQAQEMWFKSSDGLDVQGWLIKPAQYEEGKKYPMVLWIHGGPWSMYSVGFNWPFQNFSAMGYAVLYTNPRGSTGYGQEFVNGIQHSYPGKDYDDLMAGVDAAIATGMVDERNLFVCGGSGGGVLTAWIVGHTDRFAAAVSMRPVINWASFLGTTDGPSWYRQFKSDPWEDPMEYHERSPLSYVERVTTPTMVMTGEADLRTPITQSEEYYRALKRLKKETLLVRMPEEYHGWRRPSHQMLQQLYLQAWFEKYKR